MKHEWRKKEKQYYLPKNTPEYLKIPSFKFLTINGEGSPESSIFGEGESSVIIYIGSFIISAICSKV